MGVADLKARDGKTHGPDQAKEYLTPERTEGKEESKVERRQREVKSRGKGGFSQQRHSGHHQHPSLHGPEQWKPAMLTAFLTSLGLEA